MFGLAPRGGELPIILLSVSSLRIDLASLNLVLYIAMVLPTAAMGLRRMQEFLIRLKGQGVAIEADEATLTVEARCGGVFQVLSRLGAQPYLLVCLGRCFDPTL